MIGGSRGLGELVSELIGAGGRPVIVTYVVGRSDAQAVTEEIIRRGASFTAIAYDVLRPASVQLAALEVTPTHLFYFANSAHLPASLGCTRSRGVR